MMGRMMGNNPSCQWAITLVPMALRMGILPHMNSHDWKERIAGRMKETGHSMKSLSLAAGLGETYVRDMLKRDRAPSAENLKKIAAVLGTTIDALSSPGSHVSALGRSIRMVPVVGAVQAGEWYEDEFSQRHVTDDISEMESVPAFDEPYARARDLIAFKVIGDSMNELCQPGGLAIVVPYDRAGFEIRNGMIVIAERELHGRFELTLKEIHRANGHWELKPRSTNPIYTPIHFPSQNDEESVRIVGIVVRFVSPTLI
jgi:SOS-response transcriptional repressor LexA